MTQTLLTLPNEIKLEIYRYALGGYTIKILHEPYQYRDMFDERSEDYFISHFKYRIIAGDPDYHSPNMTLIPIARTCRQIYSDTALMPYALNIFYFKCGWTMQKFIDARTSAQQQALTRIAFANEHIMCRAIKDKLSGLRKIHYDDEWLTTDEYFARHSDKAVKLRCGITGRYYPYSCNKPYNSSH